MTILWSYVTDGELIGRYFKRFIDFTAVNNTLNSSDRVGGPTTKEKITFNSIIRILVNKYNTYLFKDVDIDLRNSISHYNFHFLKSNRYGGIWFNYRPLNSTLTKMKRFSLPKLMLISKKTNLLLNAISITSYPLLK